MNMDSIIAAIDADIQQLQSARAVLIQAVKGSQVSTSVSSPTTRRKLSKAARARIAEAQRKRWMTKKAENVPAVTPAKEATAPAKMPTKPKLSVEARKRIADAQRKRWAAIKAKKATPASKSIKKALRQRRPNRRKRQHLRKRSRSRELLTLRRTKLPLPHHGHKDRLVCEKARPSLAGPQTDG